MARQVELEINFRLQRKRLDGTLHFYFFYNVQTVTIRDSRIRYKGVLDEGNQ